MPHGGYKRRDVTAPVRSIAGRIVDHGRSIKTVILAGGLGTRLAEETSIRPKPMVEIGGKPMLWHIMNIYAAKGFGEFVIALGYKGEVIKQYFRDFYALNNDISIDLANGKAIIRSQLQPNWTVHLIDTGAATQTGGRIKILQPIIGDNTFFATYGDGVANIDIDELLRFHRSHGRLATVTAVHPPTRFGELGLDNDVVTSFAEKPHVAKEWINGGFFVFEPEVFAYIDGMDTALEREPLEALVRRRELVAYRHSGFWHAMDTLRERQLLEEMWQHGVAPWKVWGSPQAGAARSATTAVHAA
jgi:glucose-1-phosphate cytidylyltransferase